MNPKKNSFVFAIPDTNKTFFLSVLQDFAKFQLSKPDIAAEQFALEKYDLLVRGFDLLGNRLSITDLHFDEILEKQTQGFYKPDIKNKTRFKRTHLDQIKKEIKQTLKIEKDEILAKAEKYKSEILFEYPNLNRKDTLQTLESYCLVAVQLKEMLRSGFEANSLELKNITDIYLKLGGYLGIDESEKKKEKELRSKQTIADMSTQFQETLDELPEIVDRLKYMEVVMLLNKYERQELSRVIFESGDFADMSVEEARVFVSDRRAKYD